MKKRTVVPGVVVHQCHTISHTGNLVSIVPPAHDDSILGRILPKPVIRLSEVINDMLRAIRTGGRQHDGWRRVRAGGDIGGMHNKEDEHPEGVENNKDASVEAPNAVCLRLSSRCLLGGGLRSRGFSNKRSSLFASLFANRRSWGNRDELGVAIAIVLELVVDGRRLLCLVGVGFSGIEIDLQKSGECDSGCDADDGREGEHQADHDTSEVAGQDGVDDNKEMLVAEFAEAKDNTSGEEEDEQLQVHIESGPRCWLMLGHRGNDRDVPTTELEHDRMREKISTYFLA